MTLVHVIYPRKSSTFSSCSNWIDWTLSMLTPSYWLYRKQHIYSWMA